MGGIYSPHTPQKGSRHIARRDEGRNFDDFGSRDMAGAFSGGSGGIDTPRALVPSSSLTFFQNPLTTPKGRMYKNRRGDLWEMMVDFEGGFWYN